LRARLRTGVIQSGCLIFSLFSQLDDDTVTALSSADFDQDLQPGDLGFAKDEVIVVRALRTLSIHSAAIGLG
jgi:hypothetical protein